ncbi:hypothetical protein CSUI_004577 [Cystoisospora suis]|uniref:Uncharacterized protein n=1 Tax=Cystoisospora suis TaxID=483139 RepID=A0A2C6L002_9APIC|nr:hypothetical protein CSUI_004577 [Cystoisospora suis]
MYLTSCQKRSCGTVDCVGRAFRPSADGSEKFCGLPDVRTRVVMSGGERVCVFSPLWNVCGDVAILSRGVPHQARNNGQSLVNAVKRSQGTTARNWNSNCQTERTHRILKRSSSGGRKLTARDGGAGGIACR